MASLAQDQEEQPTPICRCRVLYLGSVVSQVLKDGLDGIQEPLQQLYPDQGAQIATGVDSWLSVWSNGLLLENVDEQGKTGTRFFPIEFLLYCAAIRYVKVTAHPNVNSKGRFYPLDSEMANRPSSVHPPLFVCTLQNRAKTKPPENFLFISKTEKHANSLVRCCFHAYADMMYARQIEKSESEKKTRPENFRGTNPNQTHVHNYRNGGQTNMNQGLNGSSGRLLNGDNESSYHATIKSRRTPSLLNAAELSNMAYSNYGPVPTGTLRSVRSTTRLNDQLIPVTLPDPVPIAPPAKETKKGFKFLTLKQRKKKNARQDETVTVPIKRASSVFSIPASVCPDPQALDMSSAILVPVPLGKPKQVKAGFKFGTFSVRSKKSIEMIPPQWAPYPVVQPPMPLPQPRPLILPMPAPHPAPPTLRRPRSQILSHSAEVPYEMYQPLPQQYATLRGPPMIQGRQGQQMLSHPGTYQEPRAVIKKLPHPPPKPERQYRPVGTLNGYPQGDLRLNDKKERELIQMVQELVLTGNDDLERTQVPASMYGSHQNRFRF